MILEQLKTYMQEKKVASVNDMATYFDTDPDAIKDMLSIWVRKRKIRKIEQPEIFCKKCPQCQMLESELYEWIE